MTLLLSITTLKIDSSFIYAYQALPSEIRPIRLQEMFLSTWFKVEGQVVKRWDTRSANAGNTEL